MVRVIYFPDALNIARQYFSRVDETYKGRAPHVFPFDTFETTWCLWNILLADGDCRDQKLAEHIRDLKSLWDGGNGIGHSSYNALKDADDSALTFNVLKLAGLDPDPDPLYRYESDDHFINYSFERSTSVSANIHILDAFKGIDGRVMEKILRWLRSTQKGKGYWTDKWHSSPYYATAHAIIAISDLDRDLAKKAVDWMVSTQFADGSWGYYDRPTAEETAYCLQALSIYNRYAGHVKESVFIKGHGALLANMNEMPPLWIGKCLYAPINVIKSSVYSALTLTGIS